jgi:phosphoinositide-3-kinase, regulatory subunit 4
LISPWTADELADAFAKLNSIDLAGMKGDYSIPGMNDYLIALSRSRSIHASRPAENVSLSTSIEGSLKLSQKLTFQSQLTCNAQSPTLPSWYDMARRIARENSSSSEFTSILSVAELHQVYGLNLYPVSEGSPIVPRVQGSLETISVNEQEVAQRMKTSSSQQIDAVLRGEWGCECIVDSSLQTTVSLVGKLKSLGIPPLPQNFGVTFENEETKEVLFKGMGDWRPKIEGLVASSTSVQGHSGAVSRLAVSQDQHFFVSSSFDSTCKVWELGKIANSNGVLESSHTYSGHWDSESALPVRVNDVAILENSHSVASASSDGKVHVWKVALVTSSLPPTQVAATGVKVNNFSRVSGSSLIREIDRKEEGEIMAVSHFNTLSESVVAFATQRGHLHSWDLRCEQEPFHLIHVPEMGYLTSMAFGNDRNWVVCGTSKGYVALWDIRFQRNVKLWQHTGGQAINRLAASYAPIPGAGTNSSPRPLAFIASGSECGMFDLLDGTCRQCFQLDYYIPSLGNGKSYTEIGRLDEIDTCGGKLTSLLRRYNQQRTVVSRRAIPTMNAMVGSMGGNDQNYLITGGGDAQIRYWDFASPSKCYTISGQVGLKYRPAFEVKNTNCCRMMMCKESSEPRHQNYESSKIPRISKRGLGGMESKHHDAILDLKLIQSPIKAILSCSRDGSIKIFQ